MVTHSCFGNGLEDIYLLGYDGGGNLSVRAVFYIWCSEVRLSESGAGWPPSCKQKCCMDLSGSVWTPIFLCVLAIMDAIQFRESINLKQFKLTLCEYIIGGWREPDNLNHIILTIPVELCGLITHFGVPLGIAPGWWDDSKRSHEPCCLFTSAWMFPTISVVRNLAFTFLVITFSFKECVITGIKGLMSSGCVTNVTGTLFKMRSKFC